MRDVTEQKAAAKALERSVRLLQQGERLAHLGSWEWDVESDTSLVSTEWQRIHGLAGERLTNDEITLTCHPDDRDAVQAAFARAVRGQPYRVDHRIVLPSGETRHLMTYGVPVLDGDGRVETVLGASLDVTERVLADAALLEREQRLQRALSDTVAALGATVAQRDPYTAGHEARVAELACLIGERLGWDESVRTALRTAALVHDVGKIAIPAEILSKPTRLTPVEFELIKTHPKAGYDILAGIAFEDHVADVVLQHHERLDGSGYPAGLRGADILPAARVLAVADVVEAMVSHRPYRPALPVAEAIAEIRGGLGARYDTAAGEACLGLLIDEAFTFTES
jgi:PAS domain S-box-containing protein/putative nucleotidyltransferase with HDIG domain